MSTVGLGLGNSLMFSWYTGVRYILFDRFSNASSVAGFNFCKKKYYYRSVIPQMKISSGPERFLKFMTDLYQFVSCSVIFIYYSAFLSIILELSSSIHPPNAKNKLPKVVVG